jgi:succinate dehydrogenase / fumarate reductase iron-sulfur subunit
MKIRLNIWRQDGPNAAGKLVAYDLPDVSPDMSFLEMLDVLNERLMEKGESPVVFDHDCREGICGSCGIMIDGVAHGPKAATTTCQLHMRSFSDGAELTLEPWRASAFPVIRDLMVDRGALDRIIQAGGYVSVATGNAQDGNALPVSKIDADQAMDAAACIGCGACIAACPNGSASLFTSAKITHLGSLPQGQPERWRRALAMAKQMDTEHFGGCTLFGECQEACPKSISIDSIMQMNRDFIVASVTKREERKGGGDGLTPWPPIARSSSPRAPRASRRSTTSASSRSRSRPSPRGRSSSATTTSASTRTCAAA